MDYGRWNEWNGLLHVNKKDAVVARCDNISNKVEYINTTEVEYTNTKQDCGMRCGTDCNM